MDHHHQMGIPGVISRIDPSSSNTSLAVATATVPPQVLKVRTRLENPTLYHVVESRKRQVRQFLQHNLPESGFNSAPPGGFILQNSPIVQETQPSSSSSSSRADVNCEAEVLHAVWALFLPSLLSFHSSGPSSLGSPSVLAVLIGLSRAQAARPPPSYRALFSLGSWWWRRMRRILNSPVLLVFIFSAPSTVVIAVHLVILEEKKTDSFMH